MADPLRLRRGKIRGVTVIIETSEVDGLPAVMTWQFKEGAAVDISFETVRVDLLGSASLIAGIDVHETYSLNIRGDAVGVWTSNRESVSFGSGGASETITEEEFPEW